MNPVATPIDCARINGKLYPKDAHGRVLTRELIGSEGRPVGAIVPRWPVDVVEGLAAKKPAFEIAVNPIGVAPNDPEPAVSAADVASAMKEK